MKTDKSRRLPVDVRTRNWPQENVREVRLNLAVQLVALGLMFSLVTACRLTPPAGTTVRRQGDEIVVAGQFVHTGTRVILWMDPGGYDAYRVERRFSPLDKAKWEDSQAEVKELSSPNRYNLRNSGLSETEMER